jgi:hypothetical protein
MSLWVSVGSVPGIGKDHVVRTALAESIPGVETRVQGIQGVRISPFVYA